MAIIFWSVATYLAIYAQYIVHPLGIALVARWFGIEFEEFRVGLLLKVFQFKIGSVLYQFDLLPIGSYVKFPNPEMDEPERAKEPSRNAPTAPLASDSLPDPARRLILEQPVLVRSAIYLAAPLSGILLGLMTLAAAMSLPNSRVVVEPSALHPVKPSAVPGLAITDQVATVESEREFFRDAFLAFWYPPKFFQREWGGYIGMFVTCSAVGQQSLGAWLSCLGIIYLGWGLLSLLPLPIFAGGRVLIWWFEAAFGRLSSKVDGTISFFSLLLLLVVYGMIFYCDARWLWSLWA
jgi:membrane-associated protease RseP (regulator of RpoE activity)